MLESRKISFVASKNKIMELKTKFGGQPFWLGEPEWPLSRSSGDQLTFIGQIVLEKKDFGENVGKVAYLFINGDEDAENTWDPESGESAIIVQPGKQCVETKNIATGPTVVNENNDNKSENEWEIQLEPFVDENKSGCFENKIGGEPYWIQCEEFPFENYKFILQLDDSHVPFFVNFGCGCAYFFLDENGESGKFCWQC